MMSKATGLFISMLSLMLNFSAVVLMALTRNWFMAGVGIVFLWISWSWIMNNIMPVVELYDKETE